MEVLAAAASVAGIITLVGQSIDGLIRFKEFFSDISSASKTISRLLHDINSLIQVLQNVGDVLEQVEARKKDKNFASLDIKLADCSKDVHVWIATARVLRPASDQGGKAWMKKFRLAVNNKAVETIREEIGRHRQALCLSLAVLGRKIDLHTSHQIHQIGGKFDEAVSTSLSNHGAQEEALKRIEFYSRASLQSSASSIRSMDTIRTELSRLEAMITRSDAGSMTIGKQDLNPIGPKSYEKAIGHKSSDQSDIAATPGDIGQDENRLCSAEAESSLDEVKESGYWASETSKTGGHESSIMYAEYSQSARYRSKAYPHDLREVNEGDRSSSSVYYSSQSESKQLGADHDSVHCTLQQLIAEAYPPLIADYISLQQLVTTCEAHKRLLVQIPGMKPKIGMRGRSTTDRNSTSIKNLMSLQEQTTDLRIALKVSRDRCIEAGYSLSELDAVLGLPTTNVYAPINDSRNTIAVENNDGYGSELEDFYECREGVDNTFPSVVR